MKLRIEYHERNAWATIRTTEGTYVCTVNRIGFMEESRKIVAAWRRRVRALRDALQSGWNL